MLPPGVTANDGSNRSGNSPSNFDNAVKLGDFETGMDGWTTNGGNKQRRITDDQIPAGVVNGRHGLVVEVTGDLFPMIENQRRVKNANFQDNPYLRMHVLTQAQETDSDLVFQFRLHHTSNGGKKRGSGGSKKRSKGHSTSGSKDVNVEESALTTVPQFTPREIQWDMSDLSSDVLSTAKRLEIVWHLEDHEPQRGHRGRSNGDFDYRGIVAFDDIRLSESTQVGETKKYRDRKKDLHREHGMIVDRTIEEQSEGLEQGTYVFSDGTEIPYEFRLLDDGRYRQTLDGDVYELGGGEQ